MTMASKKVQMICARGDSGDHVDNIHNQKGKRSSPEARGLIQQKGTQTNLNGEAACAISFLVCCDVFAVRI